MATKLDEALSELIYFFDFLAATLFVAIQIDMKNSRVFGNSCSFVFT